MAERSHEIGLVTPPTKMLAALLISFVILTLVCGDTPANCTYEETQGKWLLHIGAGGHDNSLDCTQFNVESHLTVDLRYPDLAVDERNNSGFWTLIYNQGYELVIGERKYFAFFDYNKANSNLCGETKNGWAHAVDGTDWACYRASKVAETYPERKETKSRSPNISDILSRPYRVSQDFVDRINAAQSSWKATLYPEFANYTVGEMLARSGGSKGRPSKQRNFDFAGKTNNSSLPVEFDWRDVDGVNYVSPVRNQGSCGSCYAFASMAMIEARQRVASKNRVQLVLSTQDVVSCSEYAQGCEGGFPYLIAGKYGEDFGVVEEQCNPYVGKDTSVCKTKLSCTRYFTTDYYYVGGFYGACTSTLMQEELVKNGPFAISFEVYKDFLHYKSGVYHHVDVDSESGEDDHFGFDPFEITNHVVLVVGYGTDRMSGEDYWIVKNSWGEKWGENGFFRIRRGNDECSFESMAVAVTPVMK